MYWLPPGLFGFTGIVRVCWFVNCFGDNPLSKGLVPLGFAANGGGVSLLWMLRGILLCLANSFCFPSVLMVVASMGDVFVDILFLLGVPVLVKLWVLGRGGVPVIADCGCLAFDVVY